MGKKTFEEAAKVSKVYTTEELKELLKQNEHFTISDQRDIEPITFLTVAGLLGYRLTMRVTTHKALNETNESVWSDRP